MEKRAKLTEEQLNQIPKDVLVTMYLQLSDTMMQVAEQNNQLLRQVTSLEEKISILTQRHFGRKTEKASEIDELQMTFDQCGGDRTGSFSVRTQTDKAKRKTPVGSAVSGNGH